MKIPRLFAILSLVLLFAATNVSAQGVGTSGDLRGVVTDPSGAVLPGATVSAVNAERGIRRTVSTDANGEYRITGLAPATYDVIAEATGFQTQRVEGFAITVGQSAVMDFALEVSGVATEVVVTAALPLVETQRTQQADTIEETYIRALPIDRRDYLTYTLLMPGVVDSDAFADNTDFRVVQTPQSGLSFYGSNGRGNNVTVDGAEANDDSGGVRLTLGQDAVQEFVVNRSNYGAEYGGASGGVINIVSKSGTNSVHGSVFGFFRDDGLDARNPFAVDSAMAPGDLDPFPGGVSLLGAPVDPPSDRQQFGAAVGFPLAEDKTFGFISYEGLRRNESVPVRVLTDTAKTFGLTDGQAVAIAAMEASGDPALIGQAACLRGMLITDPTTPSPGFCLLDPALDAFETLAAATEPFLVNMFINNSGIFPFTADSDLFSVRFDHYFDDNDQFFFRYSFGDTSENNKNVKALVGFSRGTQIDLQDNTSVVGWFHQFSPSAHNEVRVMTNRSTSDFTTNELGGPEFNLPGAGFFNRDIFLPSFVLTRHNEFADNFTYITGGHKLKFGGTVLMRNNRSESHTFFGGRFFVNPIDNPLAAFIGLPFPINAVQAFKLGLPVAYQQGFGDPTVRNKNPLYAFYVQDTWNPMPNLTLNFGVRYEYDKRRAPLVTDNDNFAPRFGFSWDPFGDSKTVIRGGYGIYYATTYVQIDYVVAALGEVQNADHSVACQSDPIFGGDCFRQITQLFVTLSSTASSAAIFQTLLAQGVIGPGCSTAPCIGEANLTQFGIALSQTGTIAPLSVRFSGDPNFESPMAQQGSFAIEREVAPGFSVSGSYIFSRTAHIPRARDKNLQDTAPINPATGVQDWSITDLTFPGTPCVANPFLCFASPLLFQDNVYESTGNAFYHAGILEVKKRFSNSFQLFANYTFSKAIDEVTDFNSDFQPVDQTNLRGERALSSFDQRHKFVLAAVVNTKWIDFSPIIRANSARPFNLLAGTEVNNDRHSSTDRPITAAGNFVGRNTGRGPSFVTVDLRLSHTFEFNEGVGLEVLAEGFNMLNRTNFASVNNVVGSTVYTGTLNPTGSDPATGNPFPFTSVFDSRRIQLGVRLTF